MKKVFFSLVLQILLVINLQAATYYSSASGYWCLARNGKSFCFRSLPNHNAEDVFIVDRDMNVKGDLKILGSLIIEENASLNIIENGSLELQGNLDIHFAGVLNVKGNLHFTETAQVNVVRYGTIHVDGDFRNLNILKSIYIDGLLEVMGKFENQGIISGLGKVIAPGECLSFPDAITFNQSGCEGINVFNLPVSLLSFEAKSENNSILLSWKTTQEDNIDYYQLQKATDKNSFEKIANIRSGNLENNLQSYSFIYEKPFSGKNIFRLLSVDKGGIVEYLDVLVIQHSPDVEGEFSIYPNPLSGSKLKIFLNFIPEKEGTLSIINLQGKLAQKGNFSANSQSVEVDNKLEPGIYIVLLESNGYRMQQRLIVK